MRAQRTILIVAVAALALAALEPPAEVAAAGVERAPGVAGQLTPDLRVLRTEFGTFDANGVLTPASRIALVSGQRFGWRICMHTSRDQVTWREDFRLPAPPRTWGTGPETTLSSDKRRAITTRKAAPVAGCVDNAWVLVEGDPRGGHSMVLDLEGVEVASFRFEIY